jgi:hypothetical protein
VAPPTRALAKNSRQWVDTVTSKVHERLVEFVEADQSAAAALGDPDRFAERMLASVPEPSPWSDVVGPVYSTRGVARVLGGISRQAVAERRSRRRLFGVRTSDGEWVYPAWQFDSANRIVTGLPAVLACFEPDTVDGWTLASWLTSERAPLGGASVVEWLQAGRDVEPALVLARDAGRRFAA